MSEAAATMVDDAHALAETFGEWFETLEGVVVPFDTWGDTGRFLERHSRDSLTDSLSRRWKVPLLMFHNHASLPVGVAESWDVQPSGLRGRFRLAPSPEGQMAGKYARDDMLGLSIGFQPQLSEWWMNPNWDPLAGPSGLDRVTRTRSRLVEVSLTPTPVFEEAVVDSVQAVSLDGSSRSVLADFVLWRHRHACTERIGA
jgi:hypothetical protein